MAQQVGAGGATHNQGTAAEQRCRRPRFRLSQGEGDVFWGVAGRGQHTQGQLAQRQTIALRQRPVLESQIGLGAGSDQDLAARGKLAGPGKEIGVQMGFQHLGDFHAQPLGGGNVAVHVT